MPMSPVAKMPEKALVELRQVVDEISQQEHRVSEFHEDCVALEAAQRKLPGIIDKLEKDIHHLKSTKRSSIISFVVYSTLLKPRYDRAKAQRRQRIKECRDMLENCKQTLSQNAECLEALKDLRGTKELLESLLMQQQEASSSQEDCLES